jgi:TRAP-type mannitol/chloroaromatic compound transport system permease small subunit
VTSEHGAAPPNRLSLLDRFVIAWNAIGSLMVLLLVVLICADMFGRTFFAAPIVGVVEMAAISMAVIVFCQLPDTIRLGKLTRSDTFIAQFASGSRAGGLVLTGFELLGALVMTGIIIGAMPMLIESYRRGYYMGTRDVFAFPDWPIKALVVTGAAAALLCFLVRAIRFLRARPARGTE